MCSSFPPNNNPSPTICEETQTKLVSPDIIMEVKVKQVICHLKQKHNAWK